MNFENFSKIIGILFGFFLLALVPVIIRDKKRYYQNQLKNRKKDALRAEATKALYRFISEQKTTITDTQLLICWEMLERSVTIILAGGGNMGGFLPADTITKLIAVIEKGTPGDWEGFGEDLFSIELYPHDTLEVALMSEKSQCPTSLMLGELKKLERRITTEGVYKNVE